MADKLIFPIGFDLESGLKQAQTDINRTVRRLEDAIKSQSVKLPVGFDAAMAKKLREEAKDIERVLANIKNHYGNGQLKGLSIGFINTQKELEGIKRLNAQLQSMREQRTSLVNAGATEQELKRIDSAIKQTEQRLKELNYAFNRDNSFNVAISQQIVKLKNLSEELAGIDRMYARLQASAGAAGRSANTFEANEMLARRKEIMEEIAKVTRTATEAQKELFNIKGVGIGAGQSTFGYGGEQGLSAITAQIERYEQLKKELQDIEGQYERLKAMQAQGQGDQSEKINQTLQRRIAIQKELGDITQTAAQAQKALEENAKKTAAAFQRGRSAIDNFNRTMKLPENRIMNIQAKINALNQALKRVGIGSTEFNKIVAELNRLGQKLDEAKAKQQALSSEQEKGVKKATGAFREQHSYLNILIQRLAVYSSLGAVMGFLTKVREVTAEFELQRVSLGAIINDQVRANALFNEIKQFALQSPIKILDLTKYTKQMAAFRFETDSLFETTKRVADISVGLSVPMDRLIIALGHVKASTYLTGITLRQFSMAGIPMLELLADKYSELEDRAVSVADVQKRVHDKMVSFEDVNQVFTDLTSKGGMFYNMQIKQGNTLYGLWAKLGDAASVMYEQIGNTPFVNEGMKDAINMLTIMMRNWRDVARVATEAGIAFGIYKLAVMASTKATALATVWNKKDILLRQTHLKTVMAQSWSVRNFNKVLLASGVSAQKASTATWVFSRALNGLRAAIATTGIGLLVVGISLLIDRLIFGKSAADELAESLDRIKLESSQEQDKSVANFERLANVATSSTSSYKQQQEALEELRRTYKGMISEEMLTIENLKSLNGHYEQLTASVRAYINEQMKQKQIDEITNTYAYDILKIQRKIRDDLKNKYSDEQLTEFWDRFAQNVKDKTKSAGKSIGDLVNLTVSEMGASMQFAHDIGARWSLSDYEFGFDTMYHVAYLIRQQASEVEAIGKLYDSSAMAMGKFADSYNEAVNSIKENGVSLNGNILNEKDNPLLFSQQEANLEIKDAMVPTIKEAFKEAGMAFDEGWVSLIDNIDENTPHLTSSINFEPMIEKAKSESKRLQDELQKQLELLIAQREAYMKQIQAEEGKGKGKNDEAIANMKAQYNSLGESIAVLEEKAKSVNAVLPLLDSLRKKFENIAPSDPVVKIMRKRFDQIVDYTKSYAKNMRRFRMDADESMEAYRKRLTDEVDLIKKNIKAWSATKVLARLFRNKTEEQNLQNLISEAKLQLADLEKILGDMPEFETNRQSDPRLQNLKEEISLTKKLYDEYQKLEKQIGATKAAEKIQQIYSNTITTLQERAGKYGFEFELPFTDENLKANMQHFIEKMKELQKLKDKKGKPLFPNIGKEIDEAVAQLEDVDLNSLQKQLEKKLKELADRISRTKTAREFYDKVLGMTGDINLAANVTVSVYGENGDDLKNALLEQIHTAFETIPDKEEIDLSPAIDSVTGEIDYNKLAELDEQYKDVLIEGRADMRKKIIEEGRKTSAAQAQQWLKDIEKAKDYAQQRIELAAYTANQIAAINARSDLDQGTKDKLTKGYQDRETKQLAKLQYDEFKDSAMYVHIFEDLDNASTTALKNMRDRLVALKGQWQNLDPTQVKELTKAISDLDAQIAGRSPFKTMVDSFKALAKARPQKVIDADLIAATDELKRKEEDLAAATKKYTDAQTAQTNAAAEVEKARQDLADAKEIYGEDSSEVDAAKEVLRLKKETYNTVAAASKESIAAAKADVDAAAETYNKQKGIVDSVEEESNVRKKLLDDIDNANKKIDEYQSQINEALDGVRKMMEAFGASDEDMQFFDDIVGSLNEIVDAGQQAATSIGNIMSGNPALMFQGVTGGISAIGGLISGFTNLFSAGKVRKANKEIRRQQELLDLLEYSYGRLQDAADKLFGRDYLNNYNQQMKNLQAQQTAYLKMAEAERSKGKKEDEEKTKEYLENARETADEIKALEADLVSHFTGSSREDAARQFAESWLEAKASFANTRDAIMSDYKDMIRNMIIEGAAAKVIDNILGPMWDKMGEMLESGDNAGAIDYVVGAMDDFISAADNGMNVLYESLKAKGYDIQDILSDTGSSYTGIAKDVAGATSEEINANTTALTTQNFYISQILAEVRAIRSGGMADMSDPAAKTIAFDTYSILQQSNAIQQSTNQHVAEMLAECRNIALNCEKEVSLLKSVIVPKGTDRGFGVSVYMRS